MPAALFIYTKPRFFITYINEEKEKVGERADVPAGGTAQRSGQPRSTHGVPLVLAAALKTLRILVLLVSPLFFRGQLCCISKKKPPLLLLLVGNGV